MTIDPPKVTPDQRYSIVQACKVLQISRATLFRASRLGAKQGGIDYKVSKRNGKKYYLGREILRYWIS